MEASKLKKRERKLTSLGLQKKKRKTAYVVESVVGKRFLKNGTVQYRVKWQGYPESENSWENGATCRCHDLIEKYEKKMKKEGIVAEQDCEESDDEIVDDKNGEHNEMEEENNNDETEKETLAQMVGSDLKKAEMLVAHTNSKGRKLKTGEGSSSSSSKRRPLFWEPPRDGKYKVEMGKKVRKLIGIERNPKCPGKIAILVEYSDYDTEMVPSCVLMFHEAQMLIKFYQTHLEIK